MTVRTIFSIGILLIVGATSIAQKNTSKSFHPGKEWKDTDGKSIQAHGGGILYFNGVYYWYGENRDTLIVNKTIGIKGVSCYSSKDLYLWKNEGIALKPVTNDPNHDLYPGKVLERPKVIYNERTKQFVMWMHIDQKGYKYARQGVAVSKTPAGPFEFLNSTRPNNYESRDMTLFKDTDGKAYVIYSSEDNKTMHICLLTDDYLEHSATYTRIFIDMKREAPAIFKSRNKYFLITSGCKGWKPNEAMFAVSDSILGTWKPMDNPCKGAGADSTFGAQSAFVLPIMGRNESFIFMADIWKPKNLSESSYVWLPVQFNGNKLHIKWMDEWNLDFFKHRTW